ncbi:MAG TPA: phosphotransferase [Chloroflexota bacterium]|nr:phosphotransferase [Chloroflexota bacterium]
MSRTGVEPKPRWETVPREVRREVEARLGAPVRRGNRVWGGYGPSPTYRLRLADGRGVFLKAVAPASNDFMRAAYAREERVYRELSVLIADWAPAFLGSFASGSWNVMLLEDLGPKSAPPWTPGLVRRVAHALGDFHRATRGATFPDWLPPPERHLLTEARLWEWTRQAADLQALANLAGDRSDEALRWLESARPVLQQASRSLGEVVGESVLLHRDVRSDNLRWVAGKLRLLDWPHVGVGPAESDVVEFAQSVTVEGGPEPETVLGWYAERAPVRPAVLDGVVASVAGFFAEAAWRPEIPGLPRLRPFQQRQLQVTLAWASRRLGLPRPDWLEGMDADLGRPCQNLLSDGSPVRIGT